MLQKPYKYSKWQTVFFQERRDLHKWQILECNSIAVDDAKEVTNVYWIKIEKVWKPCFAEDVFITLEEDTVFKTKDELIKSIDKS